MANFASSLQAGYQMGSGIRSRLDEAKRQKGMASALQGVQSPYEQNQQAAMQTEQDKLGPDNVPIDETALNQQIDQRPYNPEVQDWYNIRKTGADQILNSGGSIDDVNAFQQYVDTTQRNGILKNATAAANALDAGQLDQAGKAFEKAYSYMGDGIRMTTTVVNGQLMAIPRDEQTNKPLSEPIPLTSDFIRRQAQAGTDNNAFLTWSWDKKKWEEQAPQRKATLRQTEAETAIKEQGTYGVVTPGGSNKTLAGVSGWKQTELNAVTKDVQAKFNSYNKNSVTYAGVPRDKEELYNADNMPKVQALTFGLVDVNPGISAGTAVDAGEKLMRLRMEGGKAFNDFMNKNVKADSNSPSGYTVKVHNKVYNLPIRWAPDGGKAAEAYAQARGQTLAGTVVRYQKSPGAAGSDWYARKYGINTQPSPNMQQMGGGGQSGSAVPPPAPAPQGRTAVPPQGRQQPTAEPPPAPGLRMPTGTEGPRGATQGTQATQPTGGIPTDRSRMGQAVPAAQDTIRMADEQSANMIKGHLFKQHYDPQTGQWDIDRETLKEWETRLRGLKSPAADDARDLIKQIKQQKGWSKKPLMTGR